MVSKPALSQHCDPSHLVALPLAALVQKATDWKFHIHARREKTASTGKNMSRLCPAFHLAQKMGERLGQCQILF
jgi:hypothetical protein